MNRARRYRVTVPLAVATGVVAFACWPREPRLKWYSSRSQSVRGEASRVSILIPAGWRIHDPGQDHRSVIGGPLVAKISAEAIRQEPMVERMLTWVRGTCFSPDRAEKAYVMVTYRPPYPDEAADDRMYVDRGNAFRSTAIREVRVGKFRYAVMYQREDRAAFDATYRQICQSFRVVRQDKS